MAERYQRSTFYSPVGSDTGEARALQQQAQSFDSLSQMASAYGAQRAAERGLQQGADEGYTLEAPKKKAGITTSGRAYNQAAVQAHLARVDADILENTARIAAESGEDPELFDSKVAGYAEGLLKNVDPSIRGRTEIAIGQQASALRQKIAAAQADTLRRNALSDVNRTLRVRADMMEAAFLDGDDERGEELMLGALEMIDGLERNADNPTGLLAYDDVQKQRQAISDAATLASVVGIAKRKAATEGVYAAQQFVEEFKAKSNSELVEQGVSLELRQAMEAKLDALVEQERGDAISAAVDRVMASADRNVAMGEASLEAIRRSAIPEADKAEIISKVNTRMNALYAANSRRYAGDITQLDMQIAAGVPPDNAEKTLTDLYLNAAFSPDEYSSKMTAVMKAREKTAGQAAEAQAVMDALARGEKLDPKSQSNQKIVNSLFEQQAAGAPAGSDPWRAKAADIVARTGILPDSAAAWIRSSAMSSDPDIASKGALLLDTISSTNPMTLEYVDEKTKGFHLQVAEMVKAGADPVSSVETARKFVYETPPQRQAEYRRAYDAEMRDKSAADRLQRLVGKDPNYDPGLFTLAPSVDLGMTADFDMLSRQYFTMTGGDIDRANELAFKDLRSRYGRTTVNGKRQLMPYAPELFGVSGDEVRAEIIRDFGKDRARNITIEPDMETGTIRSDGTANLSYALVENGPNGVEVIGKYTLPSQQDLEERIAKRREDAMRRAREVSEARQRGARELVNNQMRFNIGSAQDLESESLRRLIRPEVQNAD
jgi:uncharacterized alkaline shock family protein YloU